MLTALAVGAMVGSQVYQGMAASAQGKSEQNMANYNAQIQQQQADAIEKETAIKQKRQAQAAERKRSSLLAGLGASGAVTTRGAPLELMAAQAKESEQKVLDIGYEGATAASRARSRARLDIMGGKLARKRGRQKATGAYIGAGASLIGPFARKYEPEYWGGKSTKLTREK